MNLRVAKTSKRVKSMSVITRPAAVGKLWYNIGAMNETTGTFDGTAIRSVCHGGQVVVRAPRILRSRYTKDFGPGFYCTVMREQALGREMSSNNISITTNIRRMDSF